MTPYYEQDGITIYHGDCRDVLPFLNYGATVTDPPYGIASKWHGGNGHGWGPAQAKAALRNTWDATTPDLVGLLDLTKPTIIWGGNHFDLPSSRSWLVWRKEQNPALTLGDAELAWTNLDKVIRVFDHPRSKLTRWLVPEHPTTKPIALMRWCLGFIQDDVIIVDPFMGSATTLRAAKDLGHRAIGIEIEERYCEVAAKRLAQGVLFAA